MASALLPTASVSCHHDVVCFRLAHAPKSLLCDRMPCAASIQPATLWSQCPRCRLHSAVTVTHWPCSVCLRATHLSIVIGFQVFLCYGTCSFHLSVGLSSSARRSWSPCQTEHASLKYALHVLQVVAGRWPRDLEMALFDIMSTHKPLGEDTAEWFSE